MYGQDLLESLCAPAHAGNAAAIMRHAERHALTSATDPTLALLTDAGKAAARDMGARISGFSHLRLFHSPVQRCRQTAEQLAEGARSAGLHVEMIGTEEVLGFGYTRDMPTACRMYSEIGDAFMDRWFRSELPDSIIAEPGLIADETVAHIDRRLRETTAHGRRLDLHVSHDWNVLVVRELLLGVTHEKAGWLTFLDGVAFSRTGDKELTAAYKDSRRSSPLPWKPYLRRNRVG